jgi:alkylation response protein AidB-like acyl-CoA dehydrogenase
MTASVSAAKTAQHCLARVRSVMPRLREAGDRIEAERRVPPDVMGVLHDARLFRMTLPRSLGGDEATLRELTEATELIASVDGSTAWCLGQGSGCAMTSVLLDAAISQRVFGPADAILAWGAGIQGRAIATKGGYRVTGRWSFASGSRAATWLGAHCRIMEADGTPRRRPDGRHADVTLLVPRNEARIIDDWNVVGLVGTGSDSYELEDHFVAGEFGVDREDIANARNPGTLYKFPQIMIYAGAFAGVMLGLARGMLDELKALAMTKTPRGASSSLRESPVFQGELARFEARLRAARAYHLGTLDEVWQAVEGGAPLDLEHRMRIRLSSTFTINEALEIVVDAYRAAGQHAIFQSAPFSRKLRDALSASQQVQGRPSHFSTVGRHLLGLEPDTTMFI